jgi:ribosomal protein S18 acetylase RimI-like enzyme
MTDALTVRVAAARDIPAMARIRAESSGTAARWEERITRYLDGSVNPQQALAPRVAYVACDGDTIVGLIAGHLTRRFACDGELEWIDVAPSARGSGLAASLLRRLAVWFGEQGATRVCVNVAPDNRPAVRFYTRLGAEPLTEFFRVWPDITALPDRS